MKYFLLSFILLGLTAVAPTNAFDDYTSDWISLFNGKNLKQWTGRGDKGTGDWIAAGAVSLDQSDPKKFMIEPGKSVLVNGTPGRTVDLMTTNEFGDIEAHIEFVVPKGSNSGVYFQSRYELQIFDSWGVEQLTYGHCGGIYARPKDKENNEGHAPHVNACRKPGEWQSFDVIFRAPRFDNEGKKIKNACFVKVIQNGTVIHENVEITGPTISAAFQIDEKPTGPIMLQGDHGPVAFRNLRIRPIKLN